MKKFTVQTVAEADRDHIIFALDRHGMKVRGEDGAASALDVPPTTLSSKIIQRGIRIVRNGNRPRITVPKDKSGKVVKQAMKADPITLQHRMKGKRLKTVDENMHDHISTVLKMCNGKVGGKAYAADLLGVPPTTLRSKMIRLGVKVNRKASPLKPAQMAKLMREEGFSNDAIAERLNSLSYKTASGESFTASKVSRLR